MWKSYRLPSSIATDNPTLFQDLLDLTHTLNHKNTVRKNHTKNITNNKKINNSYIFIIIRIRPASSQELASRVAQHRPTPCFRYSDSVMRSRVLSSRSKKTIPCR